MSSNHPHMRPLRSDSLNPRPSTQASWKPQESARTFEVPDVSFVPPPKVEAAPVQKADYETAEAADPVLPMEKEIECCDNEAAEPCEASVPQEVEEAFAAAPEIAGPLWSAEEEPERCMEAAAETCQANGQEEPEALEMPVQQQETSLASCIALLLSSMEEQPQAVEEEEPCSVAEWIDEENGPEPDARAESLSEAIAAILSGAEGEDDDDDEAAVLHDAVPDRFIPEPACVPLYDDPAPRRKKRGWLWLLALVIAAGGVYAAWKCGYLSINLP